MRHALLISFIIGIVVTGIFLPYIPGDYDYSLAGYLNFAICGFCFIAFDPGGIDLVHKGLSEQGK